ncbi:MAG: hypothetical protein GX946_01340 [Oligosphaeraceae bacterium]|nr:hypothetical protein [Oligosphaeraceae bacterium]
MLSGDSDIVKWKVRFASSHVAETLVDWGQDTHRESQSMKPLLERDSVEDADVAYKTRGDFNILKSSENPEERVSVKHNIPMKCFEKNILYSLFCE